MGGLVVLWLIDRRPCGPVQTVRLWQNEKCPDPLRDLDLSGVFLYSAVGMRSPWRTREFWLLIRDPAG